MHGGDNKGFHSFSAASVDWKARHRKPHVKRTIYSDKTEARSERSWRQNWRHEDRHQYQRHRIAEDSAPRVANIKTLLLRMLLRFVQEPEHRQAQQNSAGAEDVKSATPPELFSQPAGVRAARNGAAYTLDWCQDMARDRVSAL